MGCVSSCLKGEGTQELLEKIRKKEWDAAEDLLKTSPHYAKEQLTAPEAFAILWADAPLDVIRILFKTWPESFSHRDVHAKDFVERKIMDHQWTTLKAIICEFPNVVTSRHVYLAVLSKPPMDVFWLMLDLQPNAPVENNLFMFVLIETTQFNYFQLVLKRCPNAATVKRAFDDMTPLLFLFEQESTISTDWVGAVLNANADAAKDRDRDGKYALHLAYQRGASSDIVKLLSKCYPEAAHAKDKVGRTPVQLAANKKNKKQKKLPLTPINKKNNNSFLDESYRPNGIKEKEPPGKKSYPDNALVVFRRDMLMRDVPADDKLHKENNGLVPSDNGTQQLLAGHELFEQLLNELSKKVAVKDVDTLQKAMTLQALAAEHLLNENKTVINFQSFHNVGYWYQHEVLRLAIRVYSENHVSIALMRPSMRLSCEPCLRALESKASGVGGQPKPEKSHIKAFQELKGWLTEEVSSSSYSFQGPVVKPLQSIFNKLFILRGQTSTGIIGDSVRATLRVRDESALKQIITKIKGKFPNIVRTKYRHPKNFDGLVDFLQYVHDDLTFVPGSANVLPYRLVKNSSQKRKPGNSNSKKKDKPLWYNLNFFHQLPEYHRVGNNEIFVAFELQIGLTNEIDFHRNNDKKKMTPPITSYDAYTRERILSDQPLLKNYLLQLEGGNDGTGGTGIGVNPKEQPIQSKSIATNCSGDDMKLIDNVLEGNIATEVLLAPSMMTATTADQKENFDNEIIFETGSFTLSRQQIKYDRTMIPKQSCLNNRSLNWNISNDMAGNDRFVRVIGGVYNRLDKSKRYFVDSLVVSLEAGSTHCVGLYAHVGTETKQYLVEVAFSEVSTSWPRETILVEYGRNFEYLEQICPLPMGTTGVDIIVYGRAFQNLDYENIKLALKEFDMLD